ncbi:YDG domain-containing protein, partial [Janthinobacterium sp.]|uniref:YDG domain-containing protein n=1 Tax=Janthinobacterium sp. TaxID=1871054 RepID=UPI0025C4B695
MHNHVHHASAFVLTPPYGPPLRRTALALLLASCFGAAQANPALPQVVNGQATFNQQGNIFSITNTPNTIINWQSFSIHAGEITRFIQQNGNSAVLNRITGQDPSKILGSLESNGKVFLINPNGIVFGQGAKVDVNGLVASSLGMSNEDFLSGKRQFTAGGVAGGVGNAGVINAGKGGQVLLIAPNVENTGIITAPNGEVILAAGRSVQLADPGNPDLRVLVSAPQDQALNLGQIIAQGGSIGMAGALVSQRGVLNANSAVVGENGRIMLKASGKAVLEAGSVTSATGAAGKGGEIAVLGDQVGLFGDARVDASGATGGGTVLLGGDYQGKNAAVQNARQVVVNKDASIAADATDRGQGGKVIVWGTESAQVHGSISARGGAHGGDGGFVETSGHSLAVDGIRVDTGTRAGSGKRGTWLLDPYDIEVVAGSGGSLGNVDDFTHGSPTGSTSIGASVISNANSNVILQATHHINFSSAVDMVNTGIGLTAMAGETINVFAPITTKGGAVILSANDASSTGGAYGLGANVNLDAAITSNGGNVSLSGASVTGSGVVNVGNGNLSLLANMAAGGISLSGSGSQLIGSGIAGQTVTLQADNVSLAGGINFGGTAGGASVLIKPLNSTRGIDLGTKSGTALSLSAAELAGISASSLTIGDGTNTGGMQISGALARTGDLHINSGSAITATAAVTVDGVFALDGGNWVQNGATLPGFGARSFVIGSGATFLRVAGGDGGTSAPYLIADIYGLQGIGSLGLGNSYRLAGNIDASGTANWNGGKGFIPIAGGGAAYSGVFDGAGFAIGNLAIDGRTYDSPVGLFGTLQGGTLRNLTLAGGSVAGNANVGALVGNVLGGTIDNVSSSAAVSGQRNVGGLVGSNGGMISASGASGAVSGLNSDAAGSIGGLVGLNQAGASITASMASGAVTGTRAMVGGLVGNNEGAVAQSYATGAVSGAANIGGLVGRNGGSISNAYATGAVGAAANSDPALIHENLGGLIGWSVAGSSASNVYSSGAVSGNGFAAGTAGGVVGRADTGAAVSFAFWNYETAGIQMDQGGASGRTTAQMQQQGSFNGYDFSSVWRIYDGYTTPMLKAFLKPLQVNVTDNASGKVYDGQLAAFLGTIGYVGLLDGDTGVNGSLGYGNALNVGNYNLTGLWSTKYDITLGGTTTFAIMPRVLTVSMGGNGKVYDGTLGYDGASFVLGNVVTGDNISISGSAAFLDKNAGSGKAVHASGLVLGGNELGNYSLAASTLDGTADITARLLNYGVSGAQNRVYDGTTNATLSGYFEGLVSGDQVAMAGLLGSFRDKNVGNGKVVDYQVSTGHLTGQDAGNYVLNANTGSTTADITARTLNVSLSGVNKTYDGTTGAVVHFDRIAGDTLTVAGNAAFGDKNAGTGKTVNVSNVALGGLDAGNYVLNANSGSTTADIAARTLNVSLSGVNKTYDGTTGAVVHFGDDRVAGDTLMVGGNAAFGDKNAGTGKTVNVSDVALVGLDAGNYVLNANTGSTTADIAARTLNVSLSGVNKTYDGTTGAVVHFGDDRIAGDTLTVAGDAAFGDKNAGTGKTVNVSNVALAGLDAGNYVLNANSGSTTADIATRTLNVSLSGVNKTYDGTTGAVVHFGDDRIAGDTLTVAGDAAFGDKNAGTGKTVTVSNVALGGLDAGNYVLNANTGSTTADIAARTLNVSLSGVNKTYDGTTGAVVHFGDDRIAGDTLTVGGDAAFGDKNAGTGKTVNVSNVALAGLDASNYVLNANTGSTTADIAARTLNVSLSGVNKTYDGTTGAVVHFGDDRIAGDTLTVAGNAAFGDKNAGTGKTVSVSNVALAGLDAGNYVLSSSAGSTTADIAARTLNVSLSGVNKTYDGTTGAVVHFGDDRIAGDTLTVAGNAAFGDKNAGTGKTVNVSNVALAGLDAGNYVLNANSGSTTADIAARTLNVSLSGVNKTYDGTTGAVAHFGDDRIAGDALTVAGSAAFGDKNAGVGKTINVSNVALAGLDAGNYVLNANSGSTTADISARTLNVSLSGVNKTYDGTTGAVVHF